MQYAVKDLDQDLESYQDSEQYIYTVNPDSKSVHQIHKSGINSRFKLRYKFHSKPGFRSGFRTKFKGRNTS